MGLSDSEFVPLTVEEGLWEEVPQTVEEMLRDSELVEQELASGDSLFTLLEVCGKTRPSKQKRQMGRR